MVYLIWGLTGLAIVLGFALGVTLGIRWNYSRKSVGTILVGYTGEEDEPAQMFLNLDEEVSSLESRDYAVMRIKKISARK